jgi:hypothetical protein
MAVFGTSVDSRADEMTLEIAMNDSVDSFPPRKQSTSDFRKEQCSYLSG